MVAPFGSSLLAYWPQWEQDGTTAFDIGGNGRNGVYGGGVTLGQPGIGDGNTSAMYAATRMNAFTTSLAKAFDGREGTFSIWAKVTDSGKWANGSAGYVFSLVAGADAIWIRIPAVGSRLEAAHIANGVSTVCSIAPFSQTGFFNLVMRWSVSGDFVKLDVNGATLSSQQNPGLWTGGAPTLLVIGAASLGSATPWHGWLAHAAICDRALTDAEVRSISSPFDSAAFLPARATILPTGYYSAMALGSTLYACKAGTQQAATSIDAGDTWLDLDYAFPSELASIFPTKDGTLLACASGGEAHRSVDNGKRWSRVFDCTAGYVNPWGWAQAPNGTIFAGEYQAPGGTSSIYIWRSTDNGESWVRLDGLHGSSNDHVHIVAVDPETGRLYATIGDAPKACYYSDHNGDTWTQVFDSLPQAGFTGITSLPGSRFFADDMESGANHIYRSTDDLTATIAFMPDWQYNDSIGGIAAVHGSETIFAMFSNEHQRTGQQSSIHKSTDAGATWQLIAGAPSGSYRFMFPAVDWRKRIPAELGYLVCDIDMPRQHMIRIPF